MSKKDFFCMCNREILKYILLNYFLFKKICWKFLVVQKLYHRVQHYTLNSPSIYQNKIKIIHTHACIGKLNNNKKLQTPRMNVKPFTKTFVLMCLQRTETAGILTQKLQLLLKCFLDRSDTTTLS